MATLTDRTYHVVRWIGDDMDGKWIPTVDEATSIEQSSKRVVRATLKGEVAMLAINGRVGGST